MSATIIDGKTTAETIRGEIAQEVAAKAEQGWRPPGLAVVIVGENPASRTYVRNKGKAATEAGFHSVTLECPATISQTGLLALIEQLNADPAIDGILCQLPLPAQIDEQAVTLAIDPDKDVDGFHPVNAGRLMIGMSGFVPCTPLGCKELLMRYGIPTEGRQVVVIGRSNIVGLPMAQLMMAKGKGANATVTVCHSRTQDIAAHCRQADILIAAIGKPHFVRGEWIKPGAAVIDVGINQIPDESRKSGGRLVGDVDFESAVKVAGAITPVPGGVGPMTIAMLLRNTLEGWHRRLAGPGEPKA